MPEKKPPAAECTAHQWALVRHEKVFFDGRAEEAAVFCCPICEKWKDVERTVKG